MTQKIERIFVVPGDARNGNIALQYDIEHAGWIWIQEGAAPQNNVSELRCNPDSEKAREENDVRQDRVLEFKNEFELNEDTVLTIHISADQRYEISLDGEYFGMGADHSDVKHWSFASYRVSLKKGKHVFRALCWYFDLRKGYAMPGAQISCRPGFVFAVTEEKYRNILNTGVEGSSWKVRAVKGVSFPVPEVPPSCYQSFAFSYPCWINVSEFFAETEFADPAIVQWPRYESLYGGMQQDWVLYPSQLNDQMLDGTRRSSWEVRAFIRNMDGAEHKNPDGTAHLISEEDMQAPEIKEWQKFFDGSKPLTVPANQKISVLIDLHDYLCAYPELEAQGASDALVRVEWFESLYLADDSGKGNRNEILGKKFNILSQKDYFHSFEDTVRKAKPLWWRSGRYVLLSIQSGSKPLTFHGLSLLESRYPFETESEIHFSEQVYNDIQPFMIRSMQACTHETYMDCPYYEQLMYVGDTRLEVLTAYMMTRDSSMPERAVDLFNWSRNNWNGLVAERYPSYVPQLSATYSMIWTLMVKDLLYYRGIEDKEFRQLRNGVRSMLLAVSEYVNDDGLLENLPGWSFVDWCPEWRAGVPFPSSNRGVSSIFSLHFLLSLKAAIDLEKHLPDGDSMAMLFQHFYDRTRDAVNKKFWVKKRSMLADDLTHEHFSAHAQCLALLADAINVQDVYNCYDAMLKANDISVPTVYFSFYLLETYHKFHHEEKILEKMDHWINMLKKGGAVSTWEMPEPTRSDCHAWGAHPLYHFYSSIAGIRPTEPGFKRVLITPNMLGMDHIHGSLTHPDGWIEFDFKNDGNSLHARIVLPETCEGVFRFASFGKLLYPGLNELEVKIKDDDDKRL